MTYLDLTLVKKKILPHAYLNKPNTKSLYYDIMETFEMTLHKQFLSFKDVFNVAKLQFLYEMIFCLKR